MIAPHLLLSQQLSPEQSFRLRWGQPYQPMTASPLAELVVNSPSVNKSFAMVETYAHHELESVNQFRSSNGTTAPLLGTFPSAPALLYGTIMTYLGSILPLLPVSADELRVLHEARSILERIVNGYTTVPPEFNKFYQGIANAKVRH